MSKLFCCGHLCTTLKNSSYKTKLPTSEDDWNIDDTSGNTSISPTQLLSSAFSGFHGAQPAVDYTEITEKNSELNVVAITSSKERDGTVSVDINCRSLTLQLNWRFPDAARLTRGRGARHCCLRGAAEALRITLDGTTHMDGHVVAKPELGQRRQVCPRGDRAGRPSGRA